MGRTLTSSEVARDQERRSPWLLFPFPQFPGCTPWSGGPLLPWWHSTQCRCLGITSTGGSGEAVLSLGGEEPRLLGRGAGCGGEKGPGSWITGCVWCFLPAGISILLPDDACLGYIRVCYVFIEYALCCHVFPFFFFNFFITQSSRF